MSRFLSGVIISTKMNKTVIVSVERKFRHKLYKKVMTKHKKYKVHNESLNLKVGDKVDIKETKPLSKEKHFIVVKKI